MNRLFAGYLYLLVFSFYMCVAVAEEPPATKTIQFSIEADWFPVGERNKEAITLQGKTNLPPGTKLLLKLKAGISLPLVSKEFSNIETERLVDMAQISVDNDGAWFWRTCDLITTFSPEYYEIVVTISPDQSLEPLLIEGFSEDISSFEKYYFFHIISPEIIHRRESAVKTLVKMIQDFTSFYNQLFNQIQNIEMVKKGDNEFSWALKKAMNLSEKTNEELFQILVEKFALSRGDFKRRLDQFIIQAREERLFLATAHNFYKHSYKLLFDYDSYYQKAFDENQNPRRKLLDLAQIGTTFINFDINSQLQHLLEVEITYKVIRDLMAILDRVLQIFQEDVHEGIKEKWNQAKKEVIVYLERLKRELDNYSGYGLFLVTEDNVYQPREERAELKLVDKKEKKEIFDLIDLTKDLIGKLELRLFDPYNFKLKTETQNLNNLINEKIIALLSKIQ